MQISVVNFITSQGKHIDKIYKKLVDSNSMSEQSRKHLTPVGTGPVIKSVDSCPSFRPILSALQTPTYKIAKCVYLRGIN